MKRNINRAALTKTTYNSAYVGVLSYHAFQVKEEGAYLGHILLKGSVVKTIKVDCRDSCGNYQVNIDLHQIGSSTSGYNHKEYAVQPDGCILLYNSLGDTPYRFKLEKVGKKPGAQIIKDTDCLSESDVYACTLLRPGQYDVLFNGKPSSSIQVQYPTAATPREKLNEAVRIKAGARSKKEIKLLPMQGLVFEFQEEGQVSVILKTEEKDRGVVHQEAKAYKKRKKSSMEKKTYQWRNPKYGNKS